MKGKLFTRAFFTFRNISIFVMTMAAAILYNANSPGGYAIPYPDATVYGAAFLIYIAFVFQTTASKEFQNNFLRKMKKREIQKLNSYCVKLANEARRNLNQEYMQRLKKVMQDKNGILDSFFKGDRSYLKEKIVEQTLNLVVSYVKLLNNFCIRSKELAAVDVGEIVNKINMNRRKLEFLKDPSSIEDLKKVIDMDEKIIIRLKEEKKDLERITTKLEFMQSTVNMFKHQIISNIESEEMLDTLETAVNEAEALDNVLQERRKNRMRM